jgi:hypothetical protein
LLGKALQDDASEHLDVQFQVIYDSITAVIKVTEKKKMIQNFCWIHSRLYALEEVMQFHVTEAYSILALTNIVMMMIIIIIIIMWNLKCTIIPVINGVTGIVTRSLRKNLKDIPGNI